MLLVKFKETCIIKLVCTLTHKFLMSVAPLNALLGIIWMTFSLKSLITKEKYAVKLPIFINAKYNWNTSLG